MGKTNELTVTLPTNWQLEAHDTLAISITGLNCTAQPAGALQLGTPVDSFVRGVFCYQGEPDVVEFQVAGSGEGVVRLGFCPNKVLPAEHPHLFSIQVLNGLAPQAAPSVAIVHVAATGGVALAPVPAVSVDVTGGLTGAAAPIRGVPGGSAPLLLIVPRFKVRGMSQSNPVVSGTNVLTVSLRSNVDVLSMMELCTGSSIDQDLSIAANTGKKLVDGWVVGDRGSLIFVGFGVYFLVLFLFATALHHCFLIFGSHGDHCERLVDFI